MLRAELKSVGGRHDGKLILLEIDRKFLIGREQDCHLRPNSEAISRHHCCFTLDAFCLRLRDLGSTNGTAVNGELITGQVRLEQGDQVTVGPLEFEVLLSEVDEAAESETAATGTDEPVEAEGETPPDADAGGDDVLSEPAEESSSSDTMIDLPADAVAAIDDASNTAMLTDDTTVIPSQQQQHELQQQQLQQQMAMQQQMGGPHKNIPPIYTHQMPYPDAAGVYHPGPYGEPSSSHSQASMHYSNLQTPVSVVDQHQNYPPQPNYSSVPLQPQPSHPETPEAYEQDQYGQQNLADPLDTSNRDYVPDLTEGILR